MKTELDHIFIFVNHPFLEENMICKQGFNLTKAKHHPGQGTCSKAFFLEKEYVEFIWVDNESEAAKNPVQLHRRANFKASPFGIGLRGTLKDNEVEKFWAYKPEYAPGSTIWINKLNEESPCAPLVFLMDLPSMGMKNLSDLWPVIRAKEIPQVLQHPSGITQLIKVIIRGPNNSSLNSTISRIDQRLIFENCDNFSIEITLNGTFKDFSIGNYVKFKCQGP